MLEKIQLTYRKCVLRYWPPEEEIFRTRKFAPLHSLKLYNLDINVNNQLTSVTLFSTVPIQLTFQKV